MGFMQGCIHPSAANVSCSGVAIVVHLGLWSSNRAGFELPGNIPNRLVGSSKWSRGCLRPISSELKHRGGSRWLEYLQAGSPGKGAVILVPGVLARTSETSMS